MKALTEVRSIVDQCAQYYDWSCVASCVEIVLKIEGKVPMEFRALQDLQKNTMSGFAPFRKETCGILHGLEFTETPFNHPFDGLADLLGSELDDGRFPIISLCSGLDHAAKTGTVHEYVVVQYTGADFLALSKANAATQEELVFKNLSGTMPHTHVLTYKR